MHGALELLELERCHVGLVPLEVCLGFQPAALDLCVLLRGVAAVGLVAQVSDVLLDRREQVVAVGVPFLGGSDDAILGELLHAAGVDAEDGRDGLAVDELGVGVAAWHGVPSFLACCLAAEGAPAKRNAPENIFCACAFFGLASTAGRSGPSQYLAGRWCGSCGPLLGSVARFLRCWWCWSPSWLVAAVGGQCGVVAWPWLIARGLASCGARVAWLSRC